MSHQGCVHYIYIKCVRLADFEASDLCTSACFHCVRVLANSALLFDSLILRVTSECASVCLANAATDRARELERLKLRSV